MGDVINLRQARKQRRRDEKNETAAANRAKFGRTAAEKANDTKIAERLRDQIDHAKLDPDA